VMNDSRRAGVNGRSLGIVGSVLRAHVRVPQPPSTGAQVHLSPDSNAMLFGAAYYRVQRKRGREHGRKDVNAEGYGDESRRARCHCQCRGAGHQTPTSAGAHTATVVRAIER